MIVWLQTLLLEGRHPGTNRSVIPSYIIQDVQQARIASKSTSDEPETTVPHYGMAQSIYNYRGYEIVEHGGDLPGQESQVIRVPSEMIGLAVMVNDEQMGTLYHEVIKWMILDELLGLEPIDWRTRKLTKFLDRIKSKDVVERPGRPKAPGQAHKDLIGTYHDEAYGDIVIELASTSLDHPELGRNGRSESSFVFRAVIDKVWADELLFSHFDGDVFNVTGKLVFPETGAILWDVNGQGIEARFGEGGVGFQGIWGAGEGIDGGDMDKFGIKHGAEVFFERKS